MEALLLGGVKVGSTPVTSPLPVHPGMLSLIFASQESSRRALPGDPSLNCSHQAEKSHAYVSDSFTLMKMWFLRGK